MTFHELNLSERKTPTRSEFTSTIKSEGPAVAHISLVAPINTKKIANELEVHL